MLGMKEAKLESEMRVSAQKRTFYRDQLRTARALAAADGEGFQELLFAFERLGSAKTRKVLALGGYRDALEKIASLSPLCSKLSEKFPQYHISFLSLFEHVRQARNDALHQGAFARTLTTHATQMALVLEDAFMAGLTTVSEFMIRNPVVAFSWQPISIVRQQMLANGYSYLPISIARGGKSEWYLIGEASLAQYLRSVKGKDRDGRLVQTVDEAHSANKSLLSEAATCSPETKIDAVLDQLKGPPVVVLDAGDRRTIVGLLAAADLL
jgi:hypothetical protein